MTKRVWLWATMALALHAAWWAFWPDSDLTREFRGWADKQPLGERGHEMGVRELTISRAGDISTYRMEFDGDPGYAAFKCNSAVTYAKVRGDDSTKIVVEVHDPAGRLLARKDMGPEFCEFS